MSQRIGNIAIICDQPDGKCERCGKIDDVRPYGPRGENVCFDCAMKDKATTDRQMKRILFGETLQ